MKKFNPHVSRDLSPLITRPLTRREEVAWAAGFLEGDGCCSYSTVSRYMCVAIGQAETGVLNRFAQVVGVGKVYGPYERSAKHFGTTPAFQYKVHGLENTQAIVAMLWFKLGSAKRKQAIDVLAQRMRKCRRGHVLGMKRRGCPNCVAEAWARKRQVS